MRHVDDGTLHAWLDGEVTDRAAAWIEEHLHDCPDCSARLADARATIDQAHALLARAQPEVDKPPFERLVERARPRASADARRRQWLVPASWAASVVLAAALGWAARDSAQQRLQPGTEDAAPGQAVTLTAPPTQAAPDPPVPAPEPAVAAPSVQRSSGAEPAARPAEARRTREAPAAPPAAKVAEGNVTQPESAAGAPGRSADLAAVQPSAVRRFEIGSPQEGAGIAGRLVTGTDTLPPGWRTMSRTEAAAVTGMPLYGIEGLVPTLTAVDAGNARVRTLYRLSSGELIELLQEAASGASARVPLTKPAETTQERRPGAELAAPATAPVWSGVRGEARLTLRSLSGMSNVSELNGLLRFD